jgi:hypothetical protein
MLRQLKTSANYYTEVFGTFVLKCVEVDWNKYIYECVCVCVHVCTVVIRVIAYFFHF